jgi:hypothetical protein
MKKCFEKMVLEENKIYAGCGNPVLLNDHP